jgi:SAM-dependent methyltransferase
MSTKQDNQYYFWEQAGQDGYGKAMFSNHIVEQHIRSTIWNTALETAMKLGLNKDSSILELGCGDGTFTGTVLAQNFRRVDGYDYSVSAIKRANTLYTSESIHFYEADVTKLVYTSDQHWDGAFLMGFLHHVKQDAPLIVSRLAGVASKVILVDPNGNNVIRKALEYLPSYRRAGEDSFRLNRLKSIFSSAGYKMVSWDVVSFVPPFTPSLFFHGMVRLEKFISSMHRLKTLNSTYVLGFESNLSA